MRHRMTLARGPVVHALLWAGYMCAVAVILSRWAGLSWSDAGPGVLSGFVSAFVVLFAIETARRRRSTPRH